MKLSIFPIFLMTFEIRVYNIYHYNGNSLPRLTFDDLDVELQKYL